MCRDAPSCCAESRRDDPRVRTRAVRAGEGRGGGGPGAARLAGSLHGRARVAVAAVGADGAAVQAVLGVRGAPLPRGLPVHRRGDGGRLLPHLQPRVAWLHPRRGGRGNVPSARDPEVRHRARALPRGDGGCGGAVLLGEAHERGPRRARARRCARLPAGHPLVLWRGRLLPVVHARRDHGGADLQRRQGRPRRGRARGADCPGRVRHAARVAPREGARSGVGACIPRRVAYKHRRRARLPQAVPGLPPSKVQRALQARGIAGASGPPQALEPHTP
mmetsp:Transcript_48754/g.162698  ORF Transcript_48754/g.162698 Transcript_48754/m.162698 type:complete len:276 (+) Transcript_48754:1006-1833(+)